MDKLIGKTAGWAGAAIAAASIVGGCASTPPAAEYKPPAPGLNWTAVVRNTGSYGSNEVKYTTARTDETWEGRPVHAFRSQFGTTLSEPVNGRWVAMLNAQGKAVTLFDPPVGFEWPLTVGKLINHSYKMTNVATGKSVAVEGSCKVEDYADVAVPAGTFKAYRVACTNSIGEETTFWSAPEIGIFVKSSTRRSASSPFGAGTRDMELVAQPAKP